MQIMLKTKYAKLNQYYEEFAKVLYENDGMYIIKDKTDRLDCCQALKKAERAKKLKDFMEEDYEK